MNVPSLRITNLSIRRDDRMLQSAINFTAGPGDIVGILGPNGVGKTTLLHTIAGLYGQFEGCVHVCGTPLQKLSHKERARCISLQFQTLSLGLPILVKEALEMAYSPQMKSGERPTRNLHIEESIAAFELAPLLQRDLLSLSGGEQQRVALAMGFIQNTPIVLLDEPINHLDLKYQSLALRQCQKQANEKQQCLIMSCHNLEAAQRICTKVLLLSQQGVATFGNPDTLLTPEHLEPLFDTKFRDIRQSPQAIWSAHA